MSDGGDIVLSVIGLFAGAWIFHQGFVARKRYKLIEGTPRSKIRSVAVGQVEVHGQAAFLYHQLISPFAQAACVYFSYDVQERRKSGKNHKWVSIAKGCSNEPFYLKDDTGAIIIEPSGAELQLYEDHNYHLGLFSGTTQETAFQEGLARLGIRFNNLFGNKPLRCQEIYISENDNLFVFGTAKYKEESLASSKNEDNLTIGNSPGNWFIISDHSESDVLSSLYWKMYLSIYGGPVMTIGCLLYLLYYYDIL